MAEVQAHGFSFEKWVRENLFGGYVGSYMQKWDVPADANTTAEVPVAFRHLPVSIKTTKYGCPINLGDVLRQRRIDTDFLMIVGFWRQRSPTEKWFEEIGVARFTSASWSDLWGQLTETQLQIIDAAVKNLSVSCELAQQHAKQWKRSTPEVATSRLIVNPKIDSKTQRRIQCSLPFKVFWQQVGAAPIRKDAPQLFGQVFPNPVLSAPRRFSR
ncbi:MAG: hypothetical protein C0518_08425 [Opitutus sp.]|nr:hypothetical protein [Opitutus sp.]